MISVAEVITDPDMIAPEPFTVLRSTGSWVAGGFQSNTTSIPMWGPVHQASEKEINMVPEADRIGEMRSFWSLVPIFVTRGYAPVLTTHGEVPQGSVPGYIYTLSATPAPGGSLYVNGLLQTPGIGADYTIDGVTITLAVLSPVDAYLYYTWPVISRAGQGAAASDIIQYETDQYKVMHVYRTPGSGYWRAIGTRLAAA